MSRENSCQRLYRKVTRQRSAFIHLTSMQSQPPSRPTRPLPHLSHQALLPAVTPMAGFETRDESEYTDEADAWSRCMAVRWRCRSCLRLNGRLQLLCGHTYCFTLSGSCVSKWVLRLNARANARKKTEMNNGLCPNKNILQRLQLGHWCALPGPVGLCLSNAWTGRTGGTVGVEGCPRGRERFSGETPK